MAAEMDDGFVIYINGIRLNKFRALPHWLLANWKVAKMFRELRRTQTAGSSGTYLSSSGSGRGLQCSTGGRSRTYSDSRPIRTALTSGLEVVQQEGQPGRRARVLGGTLRHRRRLVQDVLPEYPTYRSWEVREDGPNARTRATTWALFRQAHSESDVCRRTRRELGLLLSRFWSRYEALRYLFDDLVDTLGTDRIPC